MHWYCVSCIPGFFCCCGTKHKMVYFDIKPKNKPTNKLLYEEFQKANTICTVTPNRRSL